MDPLDEAWARVEAQWGDDEAHRRFIGMCMALDRLPEAGRRYKAVRDEGSARSPQAEARMETLIALATQQLQDTRVEPVVSEHKRTLQWIAFAIMMGFMGVGAWLMLGG